MTSAVRKLALKLLSAVAQHSPPDSQCWGNAMLRELDFIESDWASLRWALGGTTAILQHSIACKARTLVAKQSKQWEEWTLRNVAKKAAGLTSGVVLAAGVLTSSILGLARLSPVLFPAMGFERTHWAQWLALLVIPESIFVIAAVRLWRKKRDMARGIVLGAVTLVVHVIVHVTMHG